MKDDIGPAFKQLCSSGEPGGHPAVHAGMRMPPSSNYRWPETGKLIPNKIGRGMFFAIAVWNC
jgi:hypothetical protein